MPKEFNPFSIHEISPDHPLPGYDKEVDNIRSKGIKATAVVYHGGTARFHGMAGSLIRMHTSKILPTKPDMQIGTSAGAIVQLMNTIFDLADPEINVLVKEKVRSLSGILNPWIKLLRYSREARGLAIDLNGFITSLLKDIPMRPDFIDILTNSLTLITSGKETQDGHIPAFVSGKQITDTKDAQTALRRLVTATEVSCAMPPVLRPHTHPVSRHRYADGGLPGHPRHGNANFGEKWETDFTLSIMPRGSTIFVFDSLPNERRMGTAGVYFGKDPNDSDVITIVPTTASKFGRRNPSAALMFHPSRFDLGYEAVYGGEQRIRDILMRKGALT